MKTAAFTCIALFSLLGASACGRSETTEDVAASPAAGTSPSSAPGAATSAAPAAASASAVNAPPPGAATPGGTPATSSGMLAPAATSPAAASGTMSVRTQAVEVTIVGVTTASQIGSRQARPGHEFVIVDTSWKNVIPLTPVDKTANSSPVGGLSGFGTTKRPPPDPKNIEMKPTPYVVPMLRKQVWLFTDDRFADTIDLEAQAATSDSLPTSGFGIAKLDDVVRGKLVFEAPAGAHYRAFQLYDNSHGHALIPLGGNKPTAAAPTASPSGQNDLMQLVLSEAGFSDAAGAPAGLRYHTIGLRGISRSPTNIVEIQPSQFVFLQNEGGCISAPERNAAGLTRPMGTVGLLPPTNSNEEELMFLVPEDTKRVRLLVVPAGHAAITLAAGGDFAPSWPTPQQTIQDGSTMKVHVLPTPRPPGSLPAAGPGRELVMLDVVIESLKPRQGIDFQGTMQLRLVDSSGAFIQPSPLSEQLTCTLGDTGVIPAGQARRFRYVYDVPAGVPLKLQYRGFEKEEAVIDIKR